MSHAQGVVIIVLLSLLIVIQGAPYVAGDLIIVPRYEYTITTISDATYAVELRELGRQGWEIVSARRASDSTGAFAYEVIAMRRYE